MNIKLPGILISKETSRVPNSMDSIVLIIETIYSSVMCMK